jgi:pimeloyl-ACP methyl ester carboxylesterase
MCRELYGGEPQSEQSAAAERAWLGKLAACRARLQSQGVRLETVSAVQAAHDLELLRRALGAPQLNLVGLSYGTRIAAEAVRQLPGSIRAVYYWGPVPAERVGVEWGEVAGEVTGALFRRCASQPACHAAYPRLAADYDSVLVRLRRAPFSVTVPRSDAAPEGSMLVDDELMQEVYAQILLNRQLAAGAPLLIHTLAQHGLVPLESMAALAGGMPRAHVVITPWRGHERPLDCSIRITRAFFDAPDDVLEVTWRGSSSEGRHGPAPSWSDVPHRRRGPLGGAAPAPRCGDRTRGCVTTARSSAEGCSSPCVGRRLNRRLYQPRQGTAVEVMPTSDHGGDPACSPDVVERVRIQQQQVGQQSRSHRADRALPADGSRSMQRGGAQRGRRAQTRRNEEFQLVMHSGVA